MNLVERKLVKPMIQNSRYCSPLHLMFTDDVIIFANGEIRGIRRLLVLLEISMVALPEKYLGVRLVRGRVTRAALVNVMDALSSKLDKVSSRVFSFQGRAVFIKSILESSFIYSMAIYKWPKSVISECTAKIRNFLWAGNPKQSKMATLSWKKVTRPKKEGGLGLRKLET